LNEGDYFVYSGTIGSTVTLLAFPYDLIPTVDTFSVSAKLISFFFLAVSGDSGF